jgi:adenosylhomocysteine nucleosidase
MKIKLFVALPSEFPKEICPPDIDIIYTGIGKVNAAIAATRELSGLDPKTTLVLNYGSAGSADLPLHSLWHCRRFRQADIDVRPLVPERGCTPLDEVFYPQIGGDIIVFSEEGQICTTQDTFQQQPVYEVNDMEAYSLAKVCRIFGFDFHAYKFISDSGDAHDWKDNHHLGIEGFREMLIAIRG